MDKSKKLEVYFTQEHQYKNAIGHLRGIILKTDLEETFKWSFPTYTLANKNVIAIGKFKNHFGIWFFNGVFLTDPLKVLNNAQEGKTKAMRQWKFTEEHQIDEKKILNYIKEAIENQKKGKVLAPSKPTKTITAIPELLSAALQKNKSLETAYKALTPYKKKEFNEYITTAKREATKLTRLEKIIPMIIEGVGLNDKYK